MLWMGLNCFKATEPLRGGSLLFTPKFPEIPGTHLINLGRMKGWVNLGVTQWFSTRAPGLEIQRLNQQDCWSPREIWSFFWFPVWFRSSRSTSDILTVVSDRITRAFNRSGATRAVALGISKAFDRVWHAGLLHKPKSYGISGQIFGLISFFSQ